MTEIVASLISDQIRYGHINLQWIHYKKGEHFTAPPQPIILRLTS